MNERLQRLTERGVSIWLDQIRRTTTTGGELQHLIDEYSLRGETSNPSIFEKAILGSDDYDDELRALAREGLDAQAIFRRMSVHDVQLACDVLRPVFDELDGADGYVSIEVSPDLARDGEATLAEARALWAEVDRPNVMVKIPGTPEGMERRLDEGKSLEMASVASFFVSRVDTLVDRQLQEKGAPAGLEGTAGLANARAAYLRFEEIFRGDRFARLREAGARVQRPLWASTGVKNPSYPDTLYVDGLVAPDTINTMPMATLLAAAERADAPEDTARQDPSKDLQALADAGIDLDAVTEQLLGDGITLFKEAFASLIAGVETQREALVVGRPPTIESSIPDDLEPALAERIKQAAADGVARRLWAKDPTLWGGDEDTPELSNRLGWLTISEAMLEHVDELEQFAAAARADGLTHTVLLGMGGSSLGPEVLRRSFGLADLHVLDSTDPDAVLAVEEAIDLDSTLFVVSSKSGGTLETLSHFAHFYDRAGQDGSHFVAVTDPGSPLDELAGEKGFRGVFRNDPEIGGRYSVLSYFGLVPAALAGAPVRELLHRAQVAEENCSAFDASATNSGLWLGVALGELANRGRDKLTLVVDSPTDSFGLWAEQLVAESTGKQGRGIVPVPAEPL
ncbi:MAG TPA: transaldolase family protein, partial [Solirubrobacteraceae bacterium]